MIIKPYGNQAILVEFERVINPNTHQKVIELYQALSQKTIKGIKALIPAYNSLTICYDSSFFSIHTLSDLVYSYNNQKSSFSFVPRTLRIPVCYETTFALDLEFVLEQTQLSKDDLIQLHTQTIYQVYLLGFLPGFAYLGKVEEQLFCKRKQTPRLKVPAGALGLAGYQTGIYPSTSPGGWQIIGKCPLSILNFNLEKPFLFEIGDQVQFESIDLSTFKRIKNNPSTWNLKPI